MTQLDASQGTSESATQSQPPASTVPEEKEGYASELLAYRVVDTLSSAIVKRISDDLNEQDRVLLVSDLEQTLQGMPLAEIRGQISLMEGAFKEREQEHKRLLKSSIEEAARLEQEGVATLGVVPLLTAVAPVITAVGELAGTLPNVLNLFRTDYTITEQTFDVKEHALTSSVAGDLARKRITVFIPGLYASKDSEILPQLANLSMQAANLKVQRDALASMLPKPEMKEDPKKPEDKPTEGQTGEQQKRLAEIAAAVLKTDAALLSFEGFRVAWTTPPQGQTQTKLEQALVREMIDTLKITRLLWLSNLSSGGETTVRTGLFQGKRVGFMGGAAVSFVLADKDGKVMDGITYAQYGVVGGDLDDYMKGERMSVRYPLAYPGGDSEAS